MRIFELRFKTGKIWVAAHTAIQAIKTQLTSYAEDFDSYYEDADDIVEIPKESWPDYKVEDQENGLPIQTFEEWMKENTHPDVIACTNN